jgi:molecular chaperone GrpE
MPTAEPEAATSVPKTELETSNVLEAVRVLGDEVNNRLEVIQAMVEREIRAEMTRERVVDRLHAELQEYKQDLLLKVMRPVFVDLIQLHDDIGKMEEARQSSGEEGDAESDPVRVLLESIRTGIEDILYRQGVEPFEEEQGIFDARRQRAVTTVPTEDPELNKTVAARLRKGFQSGDKVIRPEIVSVYTLKK